MEMRTGTVTWVVALAITVFLVVTLRETLTPFLIGFTVAYLLDPVVSQLQRLRLGRMTASCLVLLSFFLVFTILLIFLIPTLAEEIRQLLSQAPEFLESLRQRALPLIERFSTEFGGGSLPSEVSDIASNNIGNAFGVALAMLESALSSGGALMDVLALLLITPLTAFFVLVNWDRIVEFMDGLIPRSNYDKTKELASEIDRRISGFVRGQLVVAIVLGSLYAVSLTIAGLELGFSIGLVAGVLNIVPLLGSTVGLLLAAVAAWYQSGDILFVVLIASIFLVGQLLESNLITPQILGKSVGLHPLAILFAILAGGSLAGVTGMLLAVPAASVLVVLGKHALDEYRKSEFYQES